MGRYIWDSTQTKASLNPGGDTKNLHNSGSPYSGTGKYPKSVYRHSFDFDDNKGSMSATPLRYDHGVRHQREFGYNPITHEKDGVFSLRPGFQRQEDLSMSF